MATPPLSSLRGATLFLLLLLNTLLWCLPFLPLALLKLLPLAGWQRGCSRLLRGFAQGWIAGTNLLLGWLPAAVWDLEGAGPVRRDASFLLLANHQSWVDIPVLLRLFGGRLPLPVFFVKKELRLLPLIGLAMWALDFPFVERYPRKLLERRPELRGRDLITARQACEHYVGQPVTMVNFPEGTRFSADKHRRSGSPFGHLLPPHVGGVAVVLATLGGQLTSILDVTLAYPGGPPPFWDFLCGRVPQIRARVRHRQVPPDFAGRDFRRDPAFRRQARRWVEELWREKEEELATLLRRPGARG
ncbi:MAG: 1-acyl-sn-glycerol-3-phosphate acyltransferase [Desulfuromonadales bacterium]|nr:1-acyl-sn-glycerol-3-phosphate acyltransferase [Desulfuromonadales bacterium]